MDGRRDRIIMGAPGAEADARDGRSGGGACFVSGRQRMMNDVERDA